MPGCFRRQMGILGKRKALQAGYIIIKQVTTLDTGLQN